MAKKVSRYFIRVHENMPEHPKIEGLSDRAFRLLMETWCWSKRTRTNGHIKAASWSRRGTPKTRAELVAAGLFDDDLMGGVIVHGWDDWQETTEESGDVEQSRSEAGLLGAHIKWHVNQNVSSPDCALCQKDGRPMARAIDSG